MNKSMKGALLSGLVFPGLGQVVFKHYKKGIALIVTVLICALVVVLTAVQKALSIVEKIELEGEPIDFDVISDAVARSSTASNSFIYNLVTFLMACCWVFGTVDAYRIGKKIDRGE